MHKPPVGPLVLVLFLHASVLGTHAGLTFCCAPANDLLTALMKGGVRCARFETPAETLRRAPEDSAVLILAGGHPGTRVEIAAETLALAGRKNLRVFVEFPAALPGMEFGAPRKATWERVVVASDVFGPALPKMHLLAMHEAHFLPVTAANPMLVVARVAGYDAAVFGLPKESHPVLFELPERRMIVATAKLSGFSTGRFAPAQDWVKVWQTILRKLDPAGAPHRLVGEPAVRTTFAAGETLPRNYERRALDRAADWVLNSRLLITAERDAAIKQELRRNGEVAPLPAPGMTPGDGSFGILEGYASGIQPNGTQLQRLPLRADCNVESAMVLAFDAALNRGRRSRTVASNLLDFVFFNSGMCQGVRADPKHPAFGHIGWGDVAPLWMVANYGDDNGRSILATILAGACLKSDRWDEPVAKALLANFRTTGKLGFRTDRLDLAPLEQNGWKAYRDGSPVNYAPHFEAALWACNLWAYRQTGFRPLFDKATNAIAMTMEVYPSQWRWQDNMERARMLWCLAWLVRLEDTPEHRGWLKRVATDLLKQHQPCGALHEQYNVANGGHYQLPASNEAYGTTETPLIQKNGDPVSDQLYVGGFALFGLHEAVAATGDAELRKAEDKLAEFLCRIQIRSEKLPWLDGWWFRAFDDRRWEAWASSADVGWGAWSLEAGWAQAWTVATLGLRDQQTSFWDFTRPSQIAKPFAKWRAEMLEQDRP